MNTIPFPDVRPVATAAGLLFAGPDVVNHAILYDLPYRCPRPVAENAYDLSYYVPTRYPAEVSDIVRLLADIQRWTGWSDQDLANLAFSPYSHRVRATSSGSVEIDAALRERVESIGNVVEHVYAASGCDPHRTDEALTHSTAVDGESAFTHLLADRFDQAYLVALRVLRPPTGKGLATGRGTRPLANATVAFLDED